MNQKPINIQEELDKVRKTMFRLLFALAMSLKVTPKKLAKFYDESKMDEYAKKFTEELLLADAKEKAKVLEKVKKIKPRIK